MLLRSLPPDAACKQPREGRQPWSTSDELLALVLEELSVLASDHRRKKPINVPRPDHLRKSSNPPGSVGIVQMARRMAAAGRVRVVGDGDAAGAG